jgi:hypothetical protein
MLQPQAASSSRERSSFVSFRIITPYSGKLAAVTLSTLPPTKVIQSEAVNTHCKVLPPRYPHDGTVHLQPMVAACCVGALKNQDGFADFPAAM